MGDMLSQAEIDALLNGSAFSGGSQKEEDLSIQEVDALGEIGNISMGTSATTLFTLLGQKVLITTPTVTITSWEEMSRDYSLPLVAVKVEYTKGLMGSNLLILREQDVKVMTDLMMGGDGANAEGILNDLHLSAISEAMNQMIGSSATSMSSMFNKRIDISPPQAFVMKFDSSHPLAEFEAEQKIVKVAFKMVVGNLIDSEIMQLLPLQFAKSLVDNLLHSEPEVSAPNPPQRTAVQQPSAPSSPMAHPPAAGYPEYDNPIFQPPMPAHQTQDLANGAAQKSRTPVNVQPVQFQSFDDGMLTFEKKNISLIMDVPLEVTVELGRTHKLIREILEFGPGSIIELDKMAGEPVDILVNGKAIAKGEVVVIDESFGVRITDIAHPSKRL